MTEKDNAHNEQLSSVALPGNSDQQQGRVGQDVYSDDEEGLCVIGSRG